ncbi:hypothetical protein OKW96_20440 [Sphingobacterium sp. KU25419]|nr:hypothetical protein OKW96_20440 [Sphingobacterium sp. KU25419]
MQSFLIDTINKDVIKSNLNGKDNIYNFDVKEDGVNTENFTFNIYKPFNYSTLDLPNLEIIASSKKENHHKPNNKYYYLFQNTDFVLEFYEIFIKQLDLFSKNGKLRLSETKYPMVLYILYTEGIQHTFTELNLKYPFLKLNYEDYIESNIFFKDFKSINDSLTSDGVAKKKK